MPPVLYMMQSSPPARAVMMTIDILGLDVEFRELNPVFREQDTPEYTKKNPMRTIPILDEGDYCLADSHAILLYLLDTYGKPQHTYLYPKDKRKRATINERLFFDCGVLFPRLRAVMAPTFFGKLTKLSGYMIANIEDGYRTLEAYLSETLYMADDTLTVADISIVATVSTLDGLHPVDKTKFPELTRWLTDMAQNDYYKKFNKPGRDQLITVLKTMMENNKRTKKSKL